MSLIIMIGSGEMLAQDVKLKTVRSMVEYFKDQDNIERLITTLKVKEDRHAPLQGVYVHYYNLGDTARIFLDSIRTNQEGQAILMLGKYPNLLSDTTGLFVFETEYFGNEMYKSVSSDLEIKRVELKLSFFQEDTVKHILVNAHEIRSGDLIRPIRDLDISLYIKGTFSLLEIGKEETDENGQVKLEFPVNMPGDSIGLLTIVSKIEDDDIYGNIESQGKINWGIPVPLPKEKHRGLGDTDAPLWMVYTLIVLLSAVWFHYLYIIFMIIKVKMSRTKIPVSLDLQ